MAIDPYYASSDPALDLYEADGVTPNAATKILLGHTGTLDTTGYGNGNVNRTGVIYGETVNLGADNSAAAINPYLKPDLSTLPKGYDAGPTLTGPVY